MNPTSIGDSHALTASTFEWPKPIIPSPNSTPPDANEIDYLKLILNSRVYDVASETPLTLANNVYSLIIK